MEAQLFNLKFTAKQLAKTAQKCEKAEKDERLKVKKAIEKGNEEGARIYAQNCIRQKNQAMNFLRLSARVDAVASRLEMAVKMKQVTSNITSISKQMEKALGTMDADQIAKAMDLFEHQFEKLDQQAGCVEGAISRTTASTIPVDEVNDLILQVADEHSLDVHDKLGVNALSTGAAAKQGNLETSEIDEDEENRLLMERLERLRS
eukprot:TRINITY_DN16029_c0_g1_i1.p1 TRINITY_DN16029_c0_g1~~TRINITY_DN16029_c0_g1_i1.p1  ORF type:complete len:205 (+),score=74.46 TRINITY_DN16029_c0_g1_i1:78-692(+)